MVLTSTLTIPAAGSVVANESNIICADLEANINSTVLRIIGPPPAPSISLNATISATQNPTTHHVTINWAEPLLSSGISRYVLTVSPTAPPCASGQCFLGAAERGTQLTLNTGQRYNLTVRADNCGDTQMGTESDQLAVLLRVPAVPTSCVTILTYNQPSGRLLFIDTTWDTVPDPEEISPGLSGNVTQYLISFQTGSSVNTEDVNISRCTVTECRLTYEAASTSSVYESVSVAAENVVGVGAARTCTAQPISTTNNVLRVTVFNVSFPTNVQLQCTFQSGFTGSARCRVQYGTDPTYMNLPYSAESNNSGMAGESVGVALRERLNSSTTYYFTVSASSGDVTVVVQGSFTTPQYNCPLHELQMVGSPTDDSYPQCQLNQDTVTTVTIPNGVILVSCYSGRQFVSVASYVCDKGYQPNVNSSVRVCRDNGVWSGNAISCGLSETIQTTLSSGAAVGITAAITGTTALVIGVLTGVLVYHCINKCRSKKPKPQQETVPDYELVSATTSGGEKIEVRENMAYGPVQKIELRENVAYGPLQH